MLDPVELIPFRRFCYMKKQTWCDETIFIEGCFKQEGSDEIHKGDNFKAHKVSGLSVEELYKLYIEYFNHTIREGEKKRIFVSVKTKEVVE